MSHGITDIVTVIAGEGPIIIIVIVIVARVTHARVIL